MFIHLSCNRLDFLGYFVIKFVRNVQGNLYFAYTLFHMSNILFETILIVALIVLNGYFSLSEIALLSVKRSRLKYLANQGNKKAQYALSLTAQSSDMLSTIQIGITMIGIFAGAFGGATVAEHLQKWLEEFSFVSAYSAPLSVLFVVLVITFLSVVVGELVPKQIALSNPEKFALHVAGPIKTIMKIFIPFVSVLSYTTDALLRLIRVKPISEPSVTEEELRYMIKMGFKSGSIEQGEHELIERVFSFNDIMVEQVMTPLDRVTMFRTDMKMDDLFAIAVADGYARYPVVNERDIVVGYITDYDIIKAEHEEKQQSLVSEFISPITSVPADTLIDDVCRSMKKTGVHIHLVYANTKDKKVIGIVTLEDIIEELLGEIVDEEDRKDALLKKKDTR